MPIQTRRDDDGQTLVIRIEGRFDFSTHQAFRDAYEHGDPNIRSYIVSICRTPPTWTVRPWACCCCCVITPGGDSARIVIENCNNDVRRILSISNFEQLFNIR